MNKKEFLEAIEEKITQLSETERKKALLYYSEMIDDRIEEGKTEEEAVFDMGSVDFIVKEILENSKVSIKDKIKDADMNELKDAAKSAVYSVRKFSSLFFNIVRIALICSAVLCFIFAAAGAAAVIFFTGYSAGLSAVVFGAVFISISLAVVMLQAAGFIKNRRLWKKTMIFAAVFMIIGFLAIFIGFFVNGFQPANFKNEIFKYETAEFGLDEIDFINIDGIKRDIKVQCGDGDRITVFYAETDFGAVNIDKTDNTLRISEENTLFNRIGLLKHKENVIFITIPNDSISLNVESNNGEIYVKGAWGADLTCKTESGDIELERINFNNIRAESTNGDVEFDEIYFKFFGAENVSGDIKGKLPFGRDSYNISSQTLSGKEDYYGLNYDGNAELGGDVDFKTVSGDIKIDFMERRTGNGVPEPPELPEPPIMKQP